MRAPLELEEAGRRPGPPAPADGESGTGRARLRGEKREHGNDQSGSGRTEMLKTLADIIKNMSIRRKLIMIVMLTTASVLEVDSLVFIRDEIHYLRDA